MNKKIKFVLIGLVLIMMAQVSVFAAYEFYVTIEGKTQGTFKGEVLRDAHSKKIKGLDFLSEIISPRDLATGRASGKPIAKPITFTKEWGVATPQIVQALITNEVLTNVKFEFIHSTPEGTIEVYMVIQLKNAYVISSEMKTSEKPVTSLSKYSVADTVEIQTISMSYQQMTIESVDGSTMTVVRAY